jgi:hypothetical protein
MHERAIVTYQPPNWESDVAKIARLRALRLAHVTRHPRKHGGIGAVAA